VLGLGSGDQPWEFQQMGLVYPPVRERQAALEEGLRIIGPLLRGEQVTYQGEHFRVEGAMLQPPAVQQPYVPLLIAGGGERTTLRFAAQYADASNLGAASWAGGAFTPDDVRMKFDVLRRHCGDAGRPYQAILRTALVGLFLSESPATLQAKMEQVPRELLGFFEQLPIVGTPEEAVPRVRALVEAGFQYVFCIILTFDMETLRLAAERVIPAVTGR
jgi:alkanesulfonate monooxygenase SsuD/methylene tetrahydromethanopterin reductase-like flavin-dependent oxidoreductase (luciferase family)